ncbi:uncharacterized protein LOC129919562 isoform X2 [Episyrphus balteatus]|uniref:uncharacterized protein LOC129919562 isoform X2 n=1 Tax=Episyrphus balteatus TaxID=286459 RepID=UPI0024868F6D|nr:uncharacterized protein LOC129919562 isoform X2 [Episyrphus balteatus]
MFLNCYYGGSDIIIKIIKKGEEFNVDDFKEAAFQAFKIDKESSYFFDAFSKAQIQDENLVEYVLHKTKAAPDWKLGISRVVHKNVVLEVANAEEDDQDNVIPSGASLVQVAESELDLGLNSSLLSSLLASSSHLQTPTIATKELYNSISFRSSKVDSSELTESNISILVKSTFSSVESFKENNDLDLIIILAKFGNSLNLDNHDRITISKFVVKQILQENKHVELSRHDFLYLAELIVQVFPGEITSAYFTPACRGQRPCGKLYDAYTYFRKKLSESKLIKRSRHRRNSEPIIAAEPEDVIESNSDLEALEWLKSEIEPWSIIENNWKQTHNLRQKLLKASSSILDYLDNFPIFVANSKESIKLLNIDAKILLPQAQNFSECWSLYYPKILKYGEKSKDNNVKQFMKIVRTNTEASKIIALIILSYMFPSSRTKKSATKASYRCSKIESQENFVAYFKTIQESDNHEINLAKNNSGKQPRIVVLGDPSKKLNAYVTLLDKKYFFEDPLEAFETCFFLFYVLDLNYPAESMMVWTFTQIFLFGIKVEQKFKKGVNMATIETIHNDLCKM